MFQWYTEITVGLISQVKDLHLQGLRWQGDRHEYCTVHPHTLQESSRHNASQSAKSHSADQKYVCSVYGGHLIQCPHFSQFFSSMPLYFTTIIYTHTHKTKPKCLNDIPVGYIFPVGFAN